MNWTARRYILLIMQTTPGSPPRVAANTGIYASESQALEALVDRIVKTIDPEAVWLFGSRARGTHRADSDFDLLVVTKQEDGDGGYDYDRVYAPVLGTGVGCDIVPCRADDFLRESKAPTGLVANVLQSGINLYERQTRRTARSRG